MELGWCLCMQGSGNAPGTIRPLVRSFGCAGFFVWLAIGAVFATFFVGEYLDRPEHQKSFWKAGVTVSFSKIPTRPKTWISGDLVRWIHFWNRGRNHGFSVPHLQLNPGKVGTRLGILFLTCLLFSLFSKFANQYILDNLTLNLCYGNSWLTWPSQVSWI